MSDGVDERFERLALLGQGGMARVWETRDRATGQRVALKEILGEQDAYAVERLRREAENARALDHPHVCRALDFRIDDDERWIAFELVEGRSLRDVIVALAPLPAPLALVWIDQLLGALAHAHGSGVLHRDVKPRNVMIAHDGALKLLDFGIARRVEDATLTATGALLGTPAYMSPEQALGQPVDQRTDLFAAGLVLHEMFTGAAFYAAVDVAVTLTRLMTTPVPPLVEVAPWAPPALQALHGALTQHDVAARCASAALARRAIATAVADVDTSWPRRAVADLEGARVEGRAATRRALLDDADALLHDGCAEGALLRLDALCRFAPGDDDARRRRDALARAHGYAFDVVDEDDLRALKQGVGARTPPVVLRRLADLYRARGRLGEHARWLRRYALAQPRDTLALEQLAALDGATRRGGLAAAGAGATNATGTTAPARPAAAAAAAAATASSTTPDPRGPRDLTLLPAPPGALGTKDVVVGVQPRAGAARGPATASSLPLVVVPAASAVAAEDERGSAAGRAVGWGVIGALAVGMGALLVMPLLQPRDGDADRAGAAAPRTPTGAELVDVAPLLAEARVQWSNGDALGVVQTTTRVLGLAHETFIVDRREAACLRARAYARLRRLVEARADAQRCIDWQVSSTSPEIEEMRAIVVDDATF